MTTMFVLAACAAAPPAAPPAQLLREVPQRAHRALGEVFERGMPGVHERHVYEALSRKAGELGADAVVLLDVERKVRPAPDAPYEERYSIGDAYPEPLDDDFGERVVPPSPWPVRIAGGVYYEARGLAIDYLD